MTFFSLSHSIKFNNANECCDRTQTKQIFYISASAISIPFATAGAVGGFATSACGVGLGSEGTVGAADAWKTIGMRCLIVSYDIAKNLRGIIV